MRQIITHFTDDDLYKFTMCCAVAETYPRAWVRYVFQDRKNTVYPKGFASALKEQIEALENLVISDEEIEFMKTSCKYIPFWFYSFLRGFRYDARIVKIRQDSEGKLSLEFEGCWTDAILLEVKILAIISELYYMMTGQDKGFDYKAYFEKTLEKGRRLLAGGCIFSEFGTRRRASFHTQDVVMAALCQARDEEGGPGRFAGTSNVYLAMKYGLKPMGTMAHEFIAALGGMYGPQMANHLAMRAWSRTYRGSLGTFLYDTFGWEIFSLNFSEDYANMFRGLRVDSGVDEDELDKIVRKYQSLGIDPATKQVIFSNALSVDRALKIQCYAAGKCLPSFGIGTHFTSDYPDVQPMNIVIKLVAAKITESWPFYNETCKLSEEDGKHTGDSAVIKRFREILHLD